MLLIGSGMQGVGKTYLSLKQSLYQAYIAQHKRKSLVFDTNNEYGQYEIDGTVHRIPILAHSEIGKYSTNKIPEVKRIIPFHPNGAPMNEDETEALLIKVITLFRGGTLFIEDLNRIYADSLPKRVSGLLCNVRHRNCDVVFHLQSIGRLLPKMRQNTKIVRYHYQLDAVADSADKLAGEIEIFYLAEKLVNAQYEQGNIRFFVYIYRETKKIKGAFSPKMFATAIQEYISENPEVTRNLERKRDPTTSKKVYNLEQATQMKTMELFKRYYGNPMPGATT